MKWLSESIGASPAQRFNIYIFTKACRCIILHRNGLFSFGQISRRVRRTLRCTLHFSASHTESHMLPSSSNRDSAAVSAATANPRHRCIIQDAEGIETMAHRRQPSWAGRLPVHRLQFRFVILNSLGEEYAPRETQKNDNVRIY